MFYLFRPRGFQDAEYVENYIKPELSSKITHNFSKFRENSLARNIFRDRILECVRYAMQVFEKIVVLYISFV